MSRLLVTGGAGFIGAQVCATAIAAGYTVRVLDDLSTGLRSNLEGLPGIELLVGDIRELACCEHAVRDVDAVIHLAARGSVPRSIDDPQATMRTNVMGTTNVLDACRRAGVRRVVQSSSSSIYGVVPGLPRREQQRPDPRSPYAASKLAAEHVAQAWHACWGVEVVTLRLFNVYGPRQRSDSSYAAVVPLFIAAALSGRPAELHGGGEQSRAFTYVEDVAEGILAALRSPRVGENERINLAHEACEPVRELHARIGALVGVDIPPRITAARRGDVLSSSADLERARTLLGWTAQTSLDAGLAATIAWHRERMSR
ncbi:hypothetical protein PPSIR1_40969 [Plesiocystis pacifica SIR-1]|uniref:NAD-dependent epimerase/dehydratase domain-containing protein n=1 Tax=Plesiocystis pacifica SIR-1 TaxID=391625 RepID=A6GG02_9BACT|nr:NAD-dependent epimerase/dehydratase family protein [Plesiocystis pacifica]EDM75189.1 hypothetical protein PPSIR1_40969 [Plesiocystis pacifica SIR-1]